MRRTCRTRTAATLVKSGDTNGRGLDDGAISDHDAGGGGGLDQLHQNMRPALLRRDISQEGGNVVAEQIVACPIKHEERKKQPPPSRCGLITKSSGRSAAAAIAASVAGSLSSNA